MKKSSKNLMKVGIGGMAGLGAMGAMGNLPGIPDEAKGLTPIVGAGVQLGAIGAVAQIGMDIIPKTKKKKTKIKW